MKKIYCDVLGCNEEAYKEQLDCCSGWTESITSSFLNTEKFKPFEKPIISKKDLCEKHFKLWCKSTYEAFYHKTK